MHPFLLAALNTDFEWVQTQRRLQVKVLEWQRGSKDNGFLLHGCKVIEVRVRGAACVLGYASHRR